MQSIGLISAGGALEDTPPFTADPLNKARPNRVTLLSQLQGGTPESPTRASNTSNWNHRAGVNVGSYLCTGRIVQQDGLRSGGPCACVSSTSGQGWEGNIKVDDRLSSGTRTWGGGTGA